MNNKYLKTKQNRKVEAKFFELFQILHPVEKQAHKFKLPKKSRIHDVFHVSLLEQNTTKKKQVKKVLELNTGNESSKKYELEAIWDSAVDAQKSESYLPSLYYLVVWKGYRKEENT